MTDHYSEIAAELRRIADDLDTLTSQDLPKPYFSIDIQPGGDHAEATVAAVDRVADVLLGVTGSTTQLSGGVYHHRVNDTRGLIHIGVYDQVTDPEQRERDAELARLRSEVARLTDMAAA